MFSCCGFKIEEWIELKFKLSDGSEIGPFRYSIEDTVAQLKLSVVYHWPKDKENGPKKVKYVNLFNGERNLADTMKLSGLLGADYSGQIIILKVVVSPLSSKNKGLLLNCFANICARTCNTERDFREPDKMELLIIFVVAEVRTALKDFPYTRPEWESVL